MLFLFSQHWNVKQLVVARAQWKKKEYGDFVMDVALLAFVSLSLYIYIYIYFSSSFVLVGVSLEKNNNYAINEPKSVLQLKKLMRLMFIQVVQNLLIP